MTPSSKQQVLVVEDDDPKMMAIAEFFEESFPGLAITRAKSLSSALPLIEAGGVNLAIVDMSLPTYDFDIDTLGGGPPQGYGGEDILLFIDSVSPSTRSVVLSQYPDFPERDGAKERSYPLRSLDRDLKSRLGEGYLGALFYEGRHGSWRADLAVLIQSIFGDDQ